MNAVNCPAAISIGRPTAGTAMDDEFNNLGANEDASFDLLAGDDVANSGLGSDEVLGNAGDDIISDHAGADVLKGQAGSDVLISRLGGDTLYGGGAYNTYAMCTDLDSVTDSNGENCATAIAMDPANCGLTDTAMFVAAEQCCFCGGGDGMPGPPIP